MPPLVIECRYPRYSSGEWEAYVDVDTPAQARNYVKIYREDHPDRPWRVRNRNTDEILMEFIPMRSI